MDEYDSLDIKAETEELSPEEQQKLKSIYVEMNNIWLKEEVKAKQRSRDRDIREGDRNTAYFHAVANQRRRKTIVHSLDGPEGPITEEKDMLDFATKFYKNLFKKEEESEVTLQDDFFSANEKVTPEQNQLLDGPFNEEEVKNVVFGSYADGAPGPDGLPFLFYQKFWDIIKYDLMAMFQDFYIGKLDIFRLNFAILTLVPKEPGASNMKKFRPISLLNCSFKIFTKVLTNRLGMIMGQLTSINQTAFIKGRYILESVVTAHEVIHSVVQSKSQGLILKLDYEKAFDKVSLDFLLDLLEKRF